MASLLQLGHQVTSLSFRRGNMATDFVPTWPNVDLGHMPNQQFLKRIMCLLRALPRVVLNIGALRDADILIARNFDLLVLAWFARVCLIGRRPKLIYECLDIHSLFTGTGAVSRLMRWLERALLRKIDLLWVSSPGFIRCYFEPVQGYRGPHALLENKLWFDGPSPPRPDRRDRGAGRPVTIGWVGSIRCQASLDLLTGLAERLGDAVQIAIHGNIHRHAVPDFDQAIGRFDTITYHGPYTYPDDLGRVYADCDAVWAQDLWQRGGNSDWLLPNRIYEASWFGCPSIAVSDTETGRRVESAGLGFTIAQPTPDALANLVRDLTRDRLAAASRRLLTMPDRAFRLDVDDVAQALAAVDAHPEIRLSLSKP
ncbi:MAG: glycosyltransferase [Pseudomonadota bacterium]